MAKTKPEAKKAWRKGGGGFGSVSRPPAAEGAGEPARLTAQERATREIRKYQKDGGYLIPRTAFLCLTREVFNKVTRGMGGRSHAAICNRWIADDGRDSRRPGIQ